MSIFSKMRFFAGEHPEMLALISQAEMRVRVIRKMGDMLIEGDRLFKEDLAGVLKKHAGFPTGDLVNDFDRLLTFGFERQVELRERMEALEEKAAAADARTTSA